MEIFSQFVVFENCQGIGFFWVDNLFVNVQSQYVCEGLQKVFEYFVGDDFVCVVVLLCRGWMFIVGVDIKEFGKLCLLLDINDI